jgi:hypothetical protein
MAYFIDLFSPETYEIFSKTQMNLSGFRKRQLNVAQKIHPGDKLLCYMTKLSRWVGVLEVVKDAILDEKTPLFYSENDPFVVRFGVRPLVWLDKELAIPIREDSIWETLSFTRGHQKHSSSWTGKFRSSLIQLSDKDGSFLENLLLRQVHGGQEYKVDEEEYRKYLKPQIRRSDTQVVTVVIPYESDTEDTGKDVTQPDVSIRESIKIQAILAIIGEKMEFNIWIPKNDRSRVLQEWTPGKGSLLEELPLNYNEATSRTIEQIDVLWIKKRSIVRAFEVEHTTSVYSGILRMADLLALQPNINIKLHIVAPTSRKDKVFQEIQRPVFSLLDIGPLSDFCTYISYDSLIELSKQKHLSHLSDSVLEEYAEEVE